ncbi:tegument protein [Murid herpesvirus 3]|uniref:Tegument protein n=2 Tax=Murid betaherpesvirus 3 TaxID=2560603 RepID=A0A1P8VIW8_9BETA|nr:tegument protein [Murine roseolovirus]APZ76294.1 tegument protein [Murid betaherpesvirus 3]AYH64759.1 tegument protein [Murid herpesvirus 3]
MMQTSRFTVGSLAIIRSFLQYECNWYKVSHSKFFVEYESLSPSSPNFPIEKLCYVSCRIIIFKKRCYLLSLSINGVHYAQFMTNNLKMTKCTFHDYKYYILTMDPIVTCNIGFIPNYNYDLKPNSPSITAGAMYYNCTMITQDDLDDMNGKLATLGGSGVWYYKKDNTVQIITFVVNFDVFVACCESDMFPSLARIMYDTVGCQDEKCDFCNQHEIHVDPACKEIGCKINLNTCFCYVSCKKRKAKIFNEKYIYLFSEETITHLDILKSSNNVKSDINCHVHGYNNEEPVLIKNSNWSLVKIDPNLSNLIIKSCPILKRVVGI